MNLVLAFFLILGAFPAAASGIPESIIRVGVLEKAGSANIGAEGKFALFELNTGRKLAYSGKDILLVKADSRGILISGKVLASPVRASSLEKGKFLRLNGRRYRDSLIIRKEKEGNVTVINELGIDGYLYGILPREIGPDWPEESLKAQAVVSRTFALRNLSRHESAGYNLCARDHCQVYGGLDGEAPETNRAVDATHHAVLAWKGSLANTFFFANCGGRTADPADAWEGSESIPYLRSVRCRFCRNGRHFRWDAVVDERTLLQSFDRAGVGIERPIRSIKTSGTTHSGRAASVVIRHAGGEVRLRAGRFRMIAGPAVVRSTMISGVRRTKGGFYFFGKGWGHGVGLCQEGAKSLAGRGTGYEDILDFYYPGTVLSVLED